MTDQNQLVVDRYEASREEELDEIIQNYEEEIHEAWGEICEKEGHSDVLVYLSVDKEAFDIIAGARTEFLNGIEGVDSIKLKKFLQIPSQSSDPLGLRRFWVIAMDNQTGANVIWQMTTYIWMSQGGSC